MLTPYVPYPPSSGGQIRTYNLLKYLSKTNEITLVVLYKNENEKKYYKPLEKYCKNIYLCKRAEKPWQINNIFKTLFSFNPFLIIRNYSKQAKQVVTKLLKTEKFDVIHAETFYICLIFQKRIFQYFLSSRLLNTKFTNTIFYPFQKLFSFYFILIL